jgi:hypothetical protein
MVRGLDLFKEHFKEYSEQYVLIGGSACFVLFDDAGLDFRPTKDLDIVLCIEALTDGFFKAFIKFISLGNYEIKEKASGDRILYRYTKPGDSSYPFQIELFSARPVGMELSEDSIYTPIKIEDEYISLSALLLNEDYYNLILQGKTTIDDISVLKSEYILLLKAKAWLNLSERKTTRAEAKSRNIKKHVEDVFRLLALLTPETRIDLANSVKNDLQSFVSKCSDVSLNDFARFNLEMDQDEALETIKKIYGLEDVL